MKEEKDSVGPKNVKNGKLSVLTSASKLEPKQEIVEKEKTEVVEDNEDAATEKQAATKLDILSLSAPEEEEINKEI